MRQWCPMRDVLHPSGAPLPCTPCSLCNGCSQKLVLARCSCRPLKCLPGAARAPIQCLGAAIKACPIVLCVQIMPSRSCFWPAQSLLLQCACAPAPVGLSVQHCHCATLHRQPLSAFLQATPAAAACPAGPHALPHAGLLTASLCHATVQPIQTWRDCKWLGGGCHEVGPTPSLRWS